MRNGKFEPGKFELIGVDTFSNEDYRVGLFDSLEAAKKKAEEKVKQNPSMFKVHIYGWVNGFVRHLWEGGNF